MKKRVLFYIFGVLAFGLGSCGDFLEEYSQNQRYATTAQDLDELLRGECFMQSSNPSSNTQETMGFSSGLTMNYPWLHVMDDDAEEFVEGDSLILRVTRVMYWVLFIIGGPIRF